MLKVYENSNGVNRIVYLYGLIEELTWSKNKYSFSDDKQLLLFWRLFLIGLSKDKTYVKLHARLWLIGGWSINIYKARVPFSVRYGFKKSLRLFWRTWVIEPPIYVFTYDMRADPGFKEAKL